MCTINLHYYFQADGTYTDPKVDEPNKKHEEIALDADTTDASPATSPHDLAGEANNMEADGEDALSAVAIDAAAAAIKALGKVNGCIKLLNVHVLLRHTIHFRTFSISRTSGRQSFIPLPKRYTQD